MLQLIFIKKLPSMGYKRIIFRVHSAQVFQETSKLPNGTVVFFTGETYNPMQYMIEMFLGKIGEKLFP